MFLTVLSLLRRHTRKNKERPKDRGRARFLLLIFTFSYDKYNLEELRGDNLSISHVR